MSIKYLSWGRPWLSSVSMLVWICIRIGAAVDTRGHGGHDGHVMVARNLIRRSRRRAHHGQLVIALLTIARHVMLLTSLSETPSSCHMIDVQEVKLVLEFWIIDVIAVHVIASTAETSCHVNIVVRDAIIMSTPVSWTVSGSARPDFVSTNCFLELLAKHHKVHTSQSYFKNSNCFSFLN